MLPTDYFENKLEVARNAKDSKVIVDLSLLLTVQLYFWFCTLDENSDVKFVGYVISKLSKGFYLT